MPPHQPGGRPSRHRRRHGLADRKQRSPAPPARSLHRCRPALARALHHRRAERVGGGMVARNGRGSTTGRTVGRRMVRRNLSAAPGRGHADPIIRVPPARRRQPIADVARPGGISGDGALHEAEGPAGGAHQANLCIAAHYDALANAAGRHRLQDFEAGCDLFDATVSSQHLNTRLGCAGACCGRPAPPP